MPISDESLFEDAIETPEQRQERKDKEKFEALGRFVQAFELMVDEVRGACLELLTDKKRHALLNIVLHHRVFTAQPLFDVMRAAYATIVLDEQNQVEALEQEATLGVLRQIAKEYKELVEARNDLVHGTWNIGWIVIDDLQVRELFVEKYKVKGEGLAAAELPKNAAELNELTRRCSETKYLIALLLQNFKLFEPPRISQAFPKVNDKWLPHPPYPE